MEGILVFYFTRIRRMFDLKLFVDTDPDTRLARLLYYDSYSYDDSCGHLTTLVTVPAVCCQGLH